MPKSMSRRATELYTKLSPKNQEQVAAAINNPQGDFYLDTGKAVQALVNQPGAYTTEPSGDIKIAPRKKKGK